MGLFSSRTVIKVASTVYNMAGPEADRPNFLKSTMFGAVMNPESKYIGETLVRSYLQGPGINQRLLFNYAVRNDFPGLPTLSMNKAISVNAEVVRPFLPVPDYPAGLVAEIQSANIADGDYEVFAERWMNENYPLEIGSQWVAEYNREPHTITVQRAGGSSHTFPAGEYDYQSRFVVCHYYTVLSEQLDPVVEGLLVTDILEGDLPSVLGFTLTSTTNTGIETYTQSQTRTITRSYSNGDPTTVTTDYPVVTTDFDTIRRIYQRDVFNGGTGQGISTTKTRTFITTWERRQVFTSSSSTTVINDIGGGHTETVVTEITGDFLRTTYNHKTDTQNISLSKVVGGNQIFIYKIGGSNAVLNALDVTVGTSTDAEYFPILPIRLNNVSITDPIYADLYESSRKLYKRATKRQKLIDLVEEVEDNPDLDEIDYAYVQWAVTLNSKEKEAIKYLYAFWKDLIPFHGLPSNYISTLVGSQAEYAAAIAAEQEWIEAQSNMFHPLYNTPRPQVPYLTEPQIFSLNFVTDHADLSGWDNRVKFSFIDELTNSGLGKPDAKAGDYWIVKGNPTTWVTAHGVFSRSGFNGDSDRRLITNSMPTMLIYWQMSETQHKIVRVHGAVHENFIYRGKAVRTNSDEALDDVDDSGFLIPLHMPSLRNSGLVSATQLASTNTYIIFNSYQVYKKKWYQTFLGMLFIFFVIVITAALIAPATVGGISGIFGTNAALGASFGFTGTGAIVAGAITNALAATLISMALTTGATAIFGEKWGAIIGQILGFTISFGMGGGFDDLASFFQPQNLLAFSSALANGYQGFVAANIAEMNAELMALSEETNARIKEIQDKLAELLGNDLAFNPMSLTDAGRGNESRTGSYLPESLDEFIQRTTLTGSDIVDMTLSIITDFADISLVLPKTA